MRFLKLTLSYDGSEYVGWQVQSNGVSIQQRVEEAWQSTTGEQIRIVASGRTDAGVHAKAQVCSLQTESEMDCATLQRALNANAPVDIGILAVEEAPEGFHAIRDAVNKTYRYQIQHGRVLDVLNRRDQWFITKSLDVDAMRDAKQSLMGEWDFSSFEAVGAERATSIRTVTQLDLIDRGEGRFQYLDIVISADGFLYNMVRNIVGTLVQVGRGTQKPDWVGWVRDQHDRKVAGPTAPAHALFLEKVEYEV